MTRELVAYPKVNVCFKILGLLNSGYCEIVSRFVLVKGGVCDIIALKEAANFAIKGNCKCEMQANTIFKAKVALAEFLEKGGVGFGGDFGVDSSGESGESFGVDSPKISAVGGKKVGESSGVCGDVWAANLAQDSQHAARQNSRDWQKKRRFLEHFSVEVDKKIPIFAGLGGGSSDAASYLLAMNEALELGLNLAELGAVARRVGADVSFFIHELVSANVRGIGDVVESFGENPPAIEILTPEIFCSTKAVFDAFRAAETAKLAKDSQDSPPTSAARGLTPSAPPQKPPQNGVDSQDGDSRPDSPKDSLRANSQLKDSREFLEHDLLNLDSTTMLKTFERAWLNDLFLPALSLYPQLKDYAKEGYFFSGSGSSFFRLKEGA